MRNNGIVLITSQFVFTFLDMTSINNLDDGCCPCNYISCDNRICSKAFHLICLIEIDPPHLHIDTTSSITWFVKYFVFYSCLFVYNKIPHTLMWWGNIRFACVVLFFAYLQTCFKIKASVLLRGLLNIWFYE